MDLKLQKELFQTLDERMKTIGVETRRVPGVDGIQVGDTLRFFVPVTDDGDPVLIELMVVNLTEEADMLQVFTTVLTGLEEEQFDRVHQAIEEWSSECPVGNYGIYAEERQLYHKYGLLFFAERDVERMADAAFNVLMLLYEMLCSHYPEIVKCAMGEEKV